MAEGNSIDYEQSLFYSKIRVGERNTNEREQADLQSSLFFLHYILAETHRTSGQLPCVQAPPTKRDRALGSRMKQNLPCPPLSTGIFRLFPGDKTLEALNTSCKHLLMTAETYKIFLFTASRARGADFPASFRCCVAGSSRK